MLNAGEAAQHTSVLASLATRPGIAGAVIVLPPEPGAELVALQAAGLAFVVVDPREPVPRDIAAVSAAHFAGARSLTAHLVAHGHRRIGLLAGPDNWLASTARRAGHNSALADAGVLPDPRLARPGEPTVRFGHEAAQHLLTRPDRPTALACFNDKVASGALAAAAGLGLRVPEDLSVVGYDNTAASGWPPYQLTTVDQNLERMASLAVAMLMEQLDGGPSEVGRLVVPARIVARQTTRP